MGNKLARTTQVSPSEYYLHDLPSSCNLVLKEVLGGGRVLKSVMCRHDEGLLLVKVYFKRGEYPDLKEHEKRLLMIREQLRNVEHSHVWPFQNWQETDKAAYLLRQYFFSNLHDRISTRPFLSLIEKKWLAFQLLLAVKQSHECGVCHGDIKCENALVTSWNWLYLADYASFKPTYLPIDNPADFSFFFDTGERRRCYLAPERFFEPTDTIVNINDPLKPAMDIFSLGCAIAELFLEGQALFDLSQLLAYRRGQYDPRPSVQKIPDAGIRDMILHMIQLHPDSRLSSEQYMQTWAPWVFPAYFSPLLHSFFSCLLPLDTDTRVKVVQNAFSELCRQMVSASAEEKQADDEGKHRKFTGTREPQSRDQGSESDDRILLRKCQSFPTDSSSELVENINALLIDDRCVRSKSALKIAKDRCTMHSQSLGKGKSDRVFDGTTVTAGLSRWNCLLKDQVEVVGREAFAKGLNIVDMHLDHPALGTNNLKSKSMFRVKAAAVAMMNAMTVPDEIVVEEVFENQVREPGGVFCERPLSVSGAVDASGPLGLSRKKEYITLPLEGGWSWHGDWEIDHSHGGTTDSEGWRYWQIDNAGQGSNMTSLSEVIKNPRTSSKHGDCGSWAAVCTADCVFRQRRWVRCRRRHACSPELLSTLSENKVLSRKYLPLGLEESKCEGMVLIASLLCASLRSLRIPQNRRVAIQLLNDSSLFIDDDARLQHVIPYVVAMLSDSSAIVRCAALQAVTNLLSLVQSFPPSDSKVFPEYILPLLSMLPDDPEESVRICYADNIHKIAETACRFLVCSQYMKELGTLDKVLSFKGPQDNVFMVPNNGNNNMELIHLRESIARVIQELVMGPKQTPTIRRALLQHVGKLCQFFGEKQCNDVLLPILPAFLNDRDEQLRAVFFEQIVRVCLFVGGASVESYLLPYIEQALNDVEEMVIVNALECLAALCVNRLLRKRVLLGVVERAAPLLCHPSHWVRKSAITFVASASANLEEVDSYALLYPVLSPFLRREPVSLFSEAALLACLKRPMSREAFNRVLSDVMLSQTAPEPEVISQRKIETGKQQKAGLQTKAGLDRQKPEKLIKALASADDPKNVQKAQVKGSPQSATGYRVANTVLKTELDDGVKVKAMESYIRNLSSTMQSRMHNWEVENSEKLQNSVTGGGSGGLFSNYNGLAEGIPVYSLPISDKVSVFQVAPSVSEETGRMAGGCQISMPFHMNSGAAVSSLCAGGLASLPTGTESMQHPVLSSSFVPKSMSRSVYGSGMVGPRKIYDVISGDSNSREGEGHSGSMNAQVSKPKESFLRESAGLVPSVEPGVTALPISESHSSFPPSSHSLLSSSSGVPIPESVWHPRGVLIAHLREHQLAVNEVAVSRDNTFFVSASDDGMVKVWDCRRLESNISFRSRLTYSLQGGRALCVTMLGTEPQVATASSDGTIHVFSIDYVVRVDGSVEKYSGLSNVKKVKAEEGAVLSVQNYNFNGPPILLYSTQRNGIHLWDVRAQSDAWVMKANPRQGYISTTTLGASSYWLVTATSRGVLTLWDLRFQIPVTSWQHPLSSLVECMQPLIPCSNTLSATSGRPLVYVAAGKDELALWNMEDGTCNQVFRLSRDMDTTFPSDATGSVIPNALAEGPKLAPAFDLVLNGESKSSDYRLEMLSEPPSRLPGIRSLLPLPEGKGVLTGGTDCKIRMWDRKRPERSYCICGPSSNKNTMANDIHYDSLLIDGVHVVQELNRRGGGKSSMLSAAATDTGGCHRDCILSLASVQASQRLLISTSRDGAINVWR